MSSTIDKALPADFLDAWTMLGQGWEDLRRWTMLGQCLDNAQTMRGQRLKTGEGAGEDGKTTYNGQTLILI